MFIGNITFTKAVEPAENLFACYFDLFGFNYGYITIDFGLRPFKLQQTFLGSVCNNSLFYRLHNVCKRFLVSFELFFKQR